jgi:DNA-binding transcriptional LysR family regulator
MFVPVVESGSFSAVAREVVTRQPAISKRVSALEEHLGAQLLMRTSRSLSLSEAGGDFYESAARLVCDLEAAESLVGSGQASPYGVVRVTAAHAFSRLYVDSPSFASAIRKSPSRCSSQSASNLVEEGIACHAWRSSHLRAIGARDCTQVIANNNPTRFAPSCRLLHDVALGT